MTNGSFDLRKREATAAVVDFLDRFAPPRGMDADAQAKRIEAIADAFARNMPVGPDYGEKVAATLRRVEDTYEGHSWPPQARFVACMPKASAISDKPAPQTYRPANRTNHYETAMRAGRPVPASAIWGRMADELPSDLVDNYRRGSIEQARAAYKERAQEIMRGQYGSAVDRYFGGAT